MSTGVEIWEKAKSRKSRIGRDDSQRTLSYWVRNAPDELTAEAVTLSSVPPIYANLPIESVEVDEVLPASLYDVTVNYAYPKRDKDVGSATLEFDTTGGQIKVTNSFKTLNKYVSPSSGLKMAPDFKGAINVSEKNVEGVEVTIPALKFTISAVLGFDVVNFDYVKMAAGLTGCTNQNPIFTFDTGEVLFLGITGTTNKDSQNQPGVDCKFHFAASQNATKLTIGDITNISKGGHEYLWIFYQHASDGDAKKAVKRPAAVYVERVFQPQDLSVLNIPEPEFG